MRMNGSADIFFQIEEVPIFYYPLSSHNKPLSMNLVVYACLVSFGADTMEFYYYSFKIFLHFGLSKSTHIHHNQLPLTKFGRILLLIN